jgi:hypothetical protein
MAETWAKESSEKELNSRHKGPDPMGTFVIRRRGNTRAKE